MKKMHGREEFEALIGNIDDEWAGDCTGWVHGQKKKPVEYASPCPVPSKEKEKLKR